MVHYEEEEYIFGRTCKSCKVKKNSKEGELLTMGGMMG